MKFFWHLTILFLLSKMASALNCSRDDLPQSINQFIVDEQGFQAFETPSWFKVPNLKAWNTPYAPHLKRTFTITGCWIPQKKFSEMGGAVLGDHAQFRKQFSRSSTDGNKEVLFFTHPEEMTQIEYGKNGYDPAQFSCEEYCATPTSSNRTLLVWRATAEEQSFKPVFIKLSISSANGIKDKTVTNEEAQRSILFNQMLTAQQDQQGLFKDTFKFFKEPFAMTFKPEGAQGDFSKGAGFVVREIPQALLDNGIHIVPALALFGSPTTDGGTEPYLLKAYKNRDAAELYQIITKKIIQPFVTQWLTASLDWDFVTESHGQNLLVELDKNGLPTGSFWYRDLDGFEFNNAQRKLRGLPSVDQELRLSAKEIKSSIYSKFNLFLSQMELFIKQHWPNAKNQSLELTLYNELMKQIRNIAQEKYGFLFDDKYEFQLNRRDRIEIAFDWYGKIVAEFAKLSSFMEFLKTRCSLTNEEQKIAKEHSVDFHTLYSFGFRFEEAIKALQDQLTQNNENQCHQSALNMLIVNMKKATADKGAIKMEI